MIPLKLSQRVLLCKDELVRLYNKSNCNAITVKDEWDLTNNNDEQAMKELSELITGELDPFGEMIIDITALKGGKIQLSVREDKVSNNALFLIFLAVGFSVAYYWGRQ